MFRHCCEYIGSVMSVSNNCPVIFPKTRQILQKCVGPNVTVEWLAVFFVFGKTGV